jgi:outer membrane protein assembly factor BamB
VLVRCAVDAQHIYFGARDGNAYCLDRRAGRLVWKQLLGSPIVTTPALDNESLYLAASEGPVYKLAAATGTIDWAFDVAAASSTKPRILSSSAVLKASGGAARLVFGAELRGWSSSAAAVYCLE